MEEKDTESEKASAMMEGMFEQMQEQNKANMEMMEMEKIANRPITVTGGGPPCVIS